jgi:hypothetical protein
MIITINSYGIGSAFEGQKMLFLPNTAIKAAISVGITSILG